MTAGQDRKEVPTKSRTEKQHQHRAADFSRTEGSDVLRWHMTTVIVPKPHIKSFYGVC